MFLRTTRWCLTIFLIFQAGQRIEIKQRSIEGPPIANPTFSDGGDASSESANGNQQVNRLS
jgi:hypothetical protein